MPLSLRTLLSLPCLALALAACESTSNVDLESRNFSVQQTSVPPGEAIASTEQIAMVPGIGPTIAQAIADAVAAFDDRLIFVALAGSPLVVAGQRAGLRVAQEAFADRAYEADGSLRNRKLPGAMIEDNAASLAQVIRMVTEGYTLSYDDQRVPIQADTICLHGDTPGSVGLARAVRDALTAAGVQLAPPGAS